MVLPDLTPLRTSRDYRLIWTAGLLSLLGSAFPLLVAIPLQLQRLTGAPLAVASVGGVELIPIVITSWYGGALADAVDRRRLILLTEGGLAVLSAGVLANALRGHPSVWPLYLAAAGAAALQGVQWPAAAALLPRVVPHGQLPAALALESIKGNTVVILGPALGGLLVAWAGLPAAYLVDLATFAVSIVLVARIRPVPPPGADRTAVLSLRGSTAGIRYAVARPELIGRVRPRVPGGATTPARHPTGGQLRGRAAIPAIPAIPAPTGGAASSSRSTAAWLNCAWCSR